MTGDYRQITRADLRAAFENDLFEVCNDLPDKLVAIDGDRVGPDFFNGTRSNWARLAPGTNVSVTKEDGATVMLTLADYF